MRRFLALAFLAVPAMSQAIVIDDFTVPYTRTISEGTWVDYQTDPTIYSGERDVQMEMQMLSEGESMLTIGGGAFAVTNGPAARTYVELEYDGVGDEVGNTGAGKRLNHHTNLGNRFPEGSRRALFHISECNLRITIGLALWKEGVELFRTTRLVDPGTNLIAEVPLPATAFAQCDSVVLSVLAGRPSTHVIMSRIEIVPEPATFLGLAAGVVALGIRRSAGRCGS